jgi:hypothetical protein
MSVAYVEVIARQSFIYRKTKERASSHFSIPRLTDSSILFLPSPLITVAHDPRQIQNLTLSLP